MAALAYVNDAKGRYGYDFTDIANKTFLPEWTANDPEAAIAWAKANPAADGTSPYMAGIIKTLAGTDPARATELLEELAANRKAGDPLREAKPMYEELLKQGLEASISWLNGISNDALYQDAAYRLASDLYSRNSAVMAKWLVENERLSPDNTLGTAKGCISSAVMRWSMSERDAAFAYFESMPEGEDCSQFFRGLFSRDVDRGGLADRENLLALIDSNPGYASDDMLARAATQLSIDFYKTPEIVGDSLSLIPLIKDEKKRNDTYRDFIKRWQRHDEEGAQRWINSGGFP